MKKLFIIPFLFVTILGYSQNTDTTQIYKKRVLENIEIDFLTSYYAQDGDNAAVTGGIGTEKLTDFTPTIVVSIPLSDDNVLVIDAGISAYSSASSSNLDPFDAGASSQGEGTTGSPWVQSSGSSTKDNWVNGNVNYSHSADDRNTIWSANINFATEYDYTSFGFGGSFTKLFNQKNTEISIKGNVFYDTWKPEYPTEIDSYLEAGQNINSGFFRGVDILNQNGSVIDKNGSDIWSPFNTTLIENKARNTYSLSLSFSQIINKNAQFSLFFDLVQQEGWLSNPMQRVYFSDKNNYYIGNAASIPNYTSPENTDVFQLADDIERLPSTRFKIPIGMRFNYFINETFVLRTYYRFYSDSWGVSSHTANLELPIKISGKFTLYPTYRYYTQTAADYFAPYEQLLSSQEFYSSDYDLSAFNSSQYGLGVTYTDIFTDFHLSIFGLKSIDFKYSYYKRNSGLNAGIVSLGFKFVMDK